MRTKEEITNQFDRIQKFQKDKKSRDEDPVRYSLALELCLFEGYLAALEWVLDES